jgi:hypothetical protein
MDKVWNEEVGYRSCCFNPELKDTLIKNSSIYTDRSEFSEIDEQCIQQQISKPIIYNLCKKSLIPEKERGSVILKNITFFIVFSIDKQKAILITK